MITLIEALNFRCLRYIRQPLGPFHVLVGPNASGKTTFLDVVAFLGRFVSDGLEAAIHERTQNFQDIVWNRSGKRFELAVEARIPQERRKLLRKKSYDTIRYELALELDTDSDQVVIAVENALLKEAIPDGKRQRDLFPISANAPRRIVPEKKTAGTSRVITKVLGGNDNFYSEIYRDSGKGWAPSFKLGPLKSALGNLPADESQFPVATWFKDLLTQGTQKFTLNSAAIRKASPPGHGRNLRPDGSNLPWVVSALQARDTQRFRNWVSHIQTALPSIETINTVERPEDKHRYLTVRYMDGLEIPSWMVSDGTLRLLALTLPAYLPDLAGIFLIEEPENGIHPRAVETMVQSLSSVYGAQVLLATHSPVILSMVEADKVLCFAKTDDGATDIVLGSQHPALRNWRGEPNLDVLFAAGVLG